MQRSGAIEHTDTLPSQSASLSLAVQVRGYRCTAEDYFNVGTQQKLDAFPDGFFPPMSPRNEAAYKAMIGVEPTTHICRDRGRPPSLVLMTTLNISLHVTDTEKGWYVIFQKQ